MLRGDVRDAARVGTSLKERAERRQGRVHGGGRIVAPKDAIPLVRRKGQGTGRRMKRAIVLVSDNIGPGQGALGAQMSEDLLALATNATSNAGTPGTNGSLLPAALCKSGSRSGAASHWPTRRRSSPASRRVLARTHRVAAASPGEAVAKRGNL